MSAFVEQTQFTDPLELHVVDRPAPEPGAGEVRVRARAAGLNPVDWKIATMPPLAEMFGVQLPAGFGNDFAGEVDAVGEGVTDFAVGDRVFGGARGRAVAEHVVVAADTLHHTPDGVDDTVAGALEVAGKTAVAAIDTVGLGEGDTVLIGGAAGGVGVLTVQLAVRAGATVIATASESNHDFLRGLGATPVTYGEGLVERVREIAPDGVTAGIDLHGIEAVEAAAALGADGGRIATIAAQDPPHGAVATGGQAARPDALEDVAALLASGDITLPIEATFPIEQIDDAIALQRGGHVRGKVVVTI